MPSQNASGLSIGSSFLVLEVETSVILDDYLISAVCVVMCRKGPEVRRANHTDKLNLPVLIPATGSLRTPCPFPYLETLLVSGLRSVQSGLLPDVSTGKIAC